MCVISALFAILNEDNVSQPTAQQHVCDAHPDGDGTYCMDDYEFLVRRRSTRGRSTQGSQLSFLY